MRLPSLAARLGGILATVIGSVAIAVGAYSLLGLIDTHGDSQGAFNLFMAGCFLIGLGMPALAGGMVLIVRPPMLTTQALKVPRSALLASGSLMLFATALMAATPMLGYAEKRPNAVAMAIFAALGVAFIRSGRKRD